MIGARCDDVADRFWEHGVSRPSREVVSVPVEKIVTCACGQQWRGTLAELVPLVQQHGRDVHNMPVTPDQVVAMAVDADRADDGGPSAASA
jgi:hypothetical protein